MRKCLTCKFYKAEEYFGKGKNKCKDCRNSESRERNAQNRLAALELLGGKCECCNISEPVFLDIDHVNDDGNVDRKKGNGKTWLSALREPDRFQLLCKNCNGAKAIAGICPHEVYRSSYCG